MRQSVFSLSACSKASVRVASALLFACCVASTAHAAQIIVYSKADNLNAGDGCSLREALINANTDSRAGSVECTRGSGADVIVLPPDTLSLNVGGADNDDAASGDFDIAGDITLLGGGTTWTVLDANHTGRIFDVLPGGRLTVRNLTLYRGSAADQGGALRVQDSALFDAEYLVVNLSRVVGGDDRVGGGIYIGDGAIATIRRSEISSSQTLGVGGRGAGIYCADGCVLDMAFSTVTGNHAADAGGGIFVASGGRTDLTYVTMGVNSASTGAGIHVEGSANLFASVIADNIAGVSGPDLGCGASASLNMAATRAVSPFQVLPSHAALPVFVEYPAAACGFPAGMFERSSLPASLQEEVLYGTLGSPYVGAPGQTHRITEKFYPYLLGQVSAANCVGLEDQHGRARVPGADCDLGAFQYAMLSIWRMSETLVAAEGTKFLNIHLSDPPAVDTTVTVSAVAPGGGIGEECDPFMTTVQFSAGQTLAQVALDPLQIFSSAGLNRPSRVCQLKGVVTSGSFLNATAGNVRVKVTGIGITTRGFSTPSVGTYLDFETVPVGTGGTRQLSLTPDTGGFAVGAITFQGSDSNRFEVLVRDADNQLVPAPSRPTADGIEYVFGTEAAGVITPVPVPVADRTAGGTQFMLRCKPGWVGDAEAGMLVTTVAGSASAIGDISYGVRCSTTHVVSFALSDNHVSEAGGPTINAVVTLDHPCLLDGDGLGGDDGDGVCFSAMLDEVVGTALSGIDYESFGGPVVFAPGESQKIIPIKVRDDADVEPDETLGASFAPPANPYLRMSGERSYTARIVEDDQLSREVKVFLRDIPARVAPGVSLPFRIAVHNRGNAELRNFRVEFDLDQPMELYALSVNGVTCLIARDRRSASCEFSGPLHPNLKADTVLNPDGSTRPLTVDEDEADAARWADSDWQTLHGVLVTADIRKPPTIDVYGGMKVVVRTGTPVAESVAAGSLVIDAPAMGASGGALGAAPLVLLASLLFRRRLRSAVGRKIGG